ncbi:MAG TPA: hypothetical protein VMT91_12550 [Anaerolineales bacterium]|nr:hypothetical protein [Anaerolineales bacterium]
MSIFEQLSNNKGTVSSALGKTLAQRVLLEGRLDILMECIDLASYEASAPVYRNIRSGAAKVVEIVAEKRPEWVAPHLGKLLPALDVHEPQTRWAIIRVMGFCARLNKPVALEAIAYAGRYIDKKEGLCLASSADLFMGDLGAISPEDAQKVFPLLEQSMENPVENEQDWLLEAIFKLFRNLDQAGQAEALIFAQHWQYSSRKSTQQRARQILRLK